MIFAIAALGGSVVLLLALKLWASMKAKPRAAPRATGMLYETSASKIDDFVESSADWWPHLRVMPLFWVASFFSAILLVLDYHFGISYAGPNQMALGIMIGSMFAAADVAVPFISLKGDVDERRGAASWVLLVLFTIASFLVVIGSTAEVSTTTGARNDAGVISFKDNQKLLTQRQTERDSIPVDRGAQALFDLADATDKAAGREGGRVKCAAKCEELTKQATDYRARAQEAKRKEQLTAEIEQIKTRLAGGTSNEQRLDSNPMASALEGMTAGALSRDGVQRYGLTVIGLFLVAGLTILWVMIGNHLAEEIAWERNRRGEIADAARSQHGLTAKYTAPLGQLLLPAPNGKEEVPGNVTINVQAADMRKRYANDEQLLETDSLFDKLLLKGEDGQVTIAALYRAYQVMVLSSDPNCRYMTQPTLAAKLIIIAQNRDDVRVTADGVIQGWVLKPVEERKEMNANVS
jgi:hypothetical protein